MGNSKSTEALLKSIADASVAGDTNKVIELSKALTDSRKSEAKADHDKAVALETKYAGEREKLAGELAEHMQKHIDGLDAKQRIGVDVHSLSFHLRGMMLNDAETTTPGCVLNPHVKARKASTGGGGGAKQRGDCLGTGMTMAQLVDAYGTAEQKLTFNASTDRNVRWNMAKAMAKIHSTKA